MSGQKSVHKAYINGVKIPKSATEEEVLKKLRSSKKAKQANGKEKKNARQLLGDLMKKIENPADEKEITASSRSSNDDVSVHSNRERLRSFKNKIYPMNDICKEETKANSDLVLEGFQKARLKGEELEMTKTVLESKHKELEKTQHKLDLTQDYNATLENENYRLKYPDSNADFGLTEAKAEEYSKILSKQYKFTKRQTEIIKIIIKYHLEGFEQVHEKEVLKLTSYPSGSVKDIFRSRREAYNKLFLRYTRSKNSPVRKGYYRLNIIDQDLNIKIFGGL
ncbi:MAG: hypothetical protein KDH95_00875 [Calditrichaeota bacterium]|nr:hypothetical protein [Calditrichota bacterium]MCB0266697.1 hypothetical protein [Calditrichota bacterium]MCB9067269.1 hypothetical protein [Calditrichia bacterium]